MKSPLVMQTRVLPFLCLINSNFDSMYIGFESPLKFVIKCAILSMTQWNPKSLGLPSPEYVSRKSVDLAMQSLRHKVCLRQLWQNSM
jgi:hypothetical protein